MAARRRTSSRRGAAGRVARASRRRADRSSCSRARGRRRRSLGPGGLLARLTKRLVERAMDAELTEHLGYERGEAPPGGVGTPATGRPRRRCRPSMGRCGSRRRGIGRAASSRRSCRSASGVSHGFDEKIVALYARGMSVRDIQAHLAELYGVEVGRDLISRVTDAVLDDVRAWQAAAARGRLPDRLPRRAGGQGPGRRQPCSDKACYLAIGVNLDGERDVLGIWFQETEGAKFWLPGPQRAQAARRPGRPDRLRRRPQRVPRSDRGGLPPDLGADLHRAPDPPQRSATSPTSDRRAGRPRPEADLHRGRRRRCRCRRSSSFDDRAGASATR